MALTRNDKMLILAAIALAAVVVSGLAWWRASAKKDQSGAPPAVQQPAPAPGPPQAGPAGGQIIPDAKPLQAAPFAPAAPGSSVPPGQSGPPPAAPAQPGSQAPPGFQPSAPAAPSGPPSAHLSTGPREDADKSLQTIFAEKPAPEAPPEIAPAPPPVKPQEQQAAPAAPEKPKKPETRAERKARQEAERKAEAEAKRAKAEALKRAQEELKKAEAELKRAEAEARKAGVKAPPPQPGQPQPGKPETRGAQPGQMQPAIPGGDLGPAPDASSGPAIPDMGAGSFKPVPAQDSKPGTAKPASASEAKPGAPEAKSASEQKAEAKPEIKTMPERRVVEKLLVFDSGSELVFTLAGAATQGKAEAMLLSAPPRLVIDLPGHWSFQRPEKPAGGQVKAIRLGNHPDKLRIVLDLAHEPKGPKHPAVEKAAEGLSVRVAK